MDISNIEIANLLDRIAANLEVQNANPFRVRAYREGAETVRNHTQAIADLVHAGQFDDLRALPNIGDGLAAVISEIVKTGQSSLLKELETQTRPESVFTQLPGIGADLARRIVEEAHIETLSELEAAAHDGRLADVKGFGEQRVEGVRTALAGMLSQSARSKQQARTGKQALSQSDNDQLPSVQLLLEIDAEYRSRAKDGDLPRIAPRRFNPDNEAWLPVMNTKREGWMFTVLFSNTPRAHELEKTADWVVIFYERNGHEQQNTVVTETHGALKGKRVVRGRAAQTQDYYHARSG